jgi:adenylate cyclase
MFSGLAPIRTEAVFEIPFPPEAVWPVLSKTDWLNRSAGLPPVTYEIKPLSDGGTQVFASARFYGLRLRWEEKPFEWREPDFYRVERCFNRGPIRRIVVGMEFKNCDGKTRLRIASEIYPANTLGRSIARAVLAPQATSGMGAVARHVTEFLRGRERTFFPKLKRTEPNESALSAAFAQLREMLSGAPETGLVAAFEGFVRDAADVDLARIRPFALARQWQEDRWDVLRLFLIATRAGVLDLSWEVLCPNCRSTRDSIITSLSKLKNTAHCEVCQIQFDAEFDKSVELKFTINPTIKKCDEDTFCLAGPGSKPHVIEQRIIEPGGHLTLLLPHRRDGLRLRSPQVSRVISGAALNGIDNVICHREGFLAEARGNSSVQLHNPNDVPIVVQLERTHWSEDILTAACVTNLQEFRDLFSQQVISPSEQIVVGQQIILFTDLRGSTAMYCGIGDAPAYALVRDHFHLLRDAIQEHRGGIVKTIGDAVMAVFSNAGDALRAVLKMHAAMRQVLAPPGQPALLLKSSLHLGPCLAVNANDRLDYFGTTVNLAARLVGCCEGGDLAVSDEFFRRPETQSFFQENQLPAVPLEMQFRGFDSPAKVWRIPAFRGK